MAVPTITFACGPYDRTLPLLTREIRGEGIDIDYILCDSPRSIFACEFSSSELVSRLAAGKNPFVALPAFPSRLFRHANIFVNRRSGLTEPKQLEGKRIGVPLLTQTAAIFIRGMLLHDYGVDTDGVHWVQGAMNNSGTHGTPTVMPLLKTVDLELNSSGRSLGQLLAAGELDAILGAAVPDELFTHPDVVRLFPDFRSREQDYFRRTGIFPIMHLVAMRQEVHAAHPQAAAALYDALCRARALALKRMNYTGALAYMLPWLPADLDEINAVMNGDPWPYGVEPNRPTLEALVTYLHEQGLTARRVAVEEIFVPV
jgi:4,5-dihydroxyphthalate decarboxylase